MNLREMRKKYLSLIEELNPNSAELTDDPDIAAKQNEVTNQVMFEMARIKKIPRYVELEVSKGSNLTFEDLERVCGNAVYQIKSVAGVDFKLKADGTVIKIMRDGTAEIDCYVYPERITEKTKDTAYEFELSPDVLEIMPYGIAADLLKSDVSSNYGSVYANRYEAMKQMLDTRYGTGTFTIEGGIKV